EEAIAEANRAQELDPLSLLMSMLRGFVLTNLRHYDEAIEQLRRVVALDPNNYTAHWYLGVAYADNKRFDDAIVTSEKQSSCQAERRARSECWGCVTASPGVE